MSCDSAAVYLSILSESWLLVMAITRITVIVVIFIWNAYFMKC